MNIRKLLAGLIASAGVLAIGLVLLETRRSSFIYGSYGVAVPENYPVIGIDVSHHQGEINFKESVDMGGANDSIQFVYIKATEGTDFKDSRYDQNAEGFASYGMNYGFYHYFQPDKPAERQALFYCETVKKYNFKLIPVIDVEVIGGQTKKGIVDSVAVFMNRVEKILEVRPMIYTYVSFYRDYLKGTTLNDELYWLASYNRENPHMEMENAIIWQFSERGTVDGIGEKVDLNVAKASFKSKVIRKRYQ